MFLKNLNFLLKNYLKKEFQKSLWILKEKIPKIFGNFENFVRKISTLFLNL